MPKKEKFIEPIPATMDEIVEAIFANHPKPRDPSKEKIKEGATCLRTLSTFPPKPENHDPVIRGTYETRNFANSVIFSHPEKPNFSAVF